MKIDRYNIHDPKVCWQYLIRERNITEDLESANLDYREICSLRVSDFTFRNVTDKNEQSNLIKFIERHEWLGGISQYTTHWFAAYYMDKLAGVILMNMPNAFSKYLGDDTSELERLISRGACISWSPKNLASSLLMFSIKWMVKNTQYRLFTAYSDPSAGELGSIYQACNFYYLGRKFGGAKKYKNPYTGSWVSDRFFRQKTAYKKYANELGIAWDDSWSHKTGMNWCNVPDDIELRLREFGKLKQSTSESMDVPKKHKYAMVMGLNKRETKKLRKEFESRVKVYDYPKNRGEL